MRCVRPRKNEPREDGLPELETFREVMHVQDPGGDTQTLIVTRRGTGKNAAVWLSLAGTTSTTAVLVGEAGDKVADMITRAKQTRYVRPSFTE